MDAPVSGPEAARRSAGPLVITGVVFGGLGLLAVLWAASPIIGIAADAVTDSVGSAFDWQVPAWVGKLILAGVLLSVSGLLLVIGGGRWLFGTLAAARRRRAASDHQLSAHQEYAHQEYAPPRQTEPYQTPALPPDYQAYPPTQPFGQPPSTERPY